MQQFVKENIRDFNLDHIFDCGQAFRWVKEEDGSYTGIAGGRVANIQYLPGEDGRGQLMLTNVMEEDFDEFWASYLDLDRDYSKIKKELADKDSIIKKAIDCGHGIRLLQQDKWETLISFIISQNNHIPRIKKCIESLCEIFGEAAGEYNGKIYYSFPCPETLAVLEPEALAECRLGYRAKYLIHTARKVVEDGRDNLESIGNPAVSPQEAFEYVTQFCGVGPKVANCILLFSMGKYDRFPVDVWIKKVMKELYNLDTISDIDRFAKERFGKYGGFAQQYLFYYIRERG